MSAIPAIDEKRRSAHQAILARDFTKTTDNEPKAFDEEYMTSAFFGGHIELKTLAMRYIENARHYAALFEPIVGHPNVQSNVVATKDLVLGSDFILAQHRTNPIRDAYLMVFNEMEYEQPDVWRGVANLDRLSTLYRGKAAVDETLKSVGFVDEPMSTDKLGGLVLDYSRGQDRLTLIVADTSIQILSYLGGKFSDALLPESSDNQIKLRTYVEQLFAR